MSEYITNFEIEDFTKSGKVKLVRIFQQATNRDLSSHNTTINWPSPALIATSETDDIVIRITFDEPKPGRRVKRIVSIFGRSE